MLTLLSISTARPLIGSRRCAEACNTGCHQVSRLSLTLPVGLLHKAEGQLSDAASKETIDQIIFFARRTLLGQFVPPLPPTTADE